MNRPGLPRPQVDRNATALRATCAALVVATFLIGVFDVSRAAAPADIVRLSGRIDAPASGQCRALVSAAIAPGYHINAHRPRADYLVPTELRLSGGGMTFAEPRYPEPNDRAFAFSADEKLLVYDGTIEITASCEGSPQGSAEAVLRYQACDEQRCLAPTSVRTLLAAADSPVGPRGSAGQPTDPSGSSQGTSVIDTTAADPLGANDGSWLARWLEQASFPLALLAVLALGLTLNLTPCVYPLVSVTVGYFGAQAGNQSSRPWLLAGLYVLGIVLSFATLGVMAAAFGGLFGGALQQPIVLVGLGVLLVTLAASSFGWITFRVPQTLMDRFGRSSAGHVGAFLMGLSMGIVAAPCIGPIVVGLLVYVGSNADPLRGFALFAALGLGMGSPYFLLAVTAGSISRLPRAGEWLGWVERFFGFLLLYMAAYFVAPLLSESVGTLVTLAVVTVGAVYLGFVESSARSLRGFTWMRRLGGTVALASVLWSVLTPHTAAARIDWQPLSVASLDRAIETNRPAVVEFGADWCLPCRVLESTTFVDVDVARLAREFSMLAADVTHETPENAALLKRFAVAGVPTIVFYDHQGDEVDRIVGYVGPDEFAARLREILAGASADQARAPGGAGGAHVTKVR